MAGRREKIEYFLSRAIEMRALSDSMKNSEARRLLLQIADDYENLARSLDKLDTED